MPSSHDAQFQFIDKHDHWSLSIVDTLRLKRVGILLSQKLFTQSELQVYNFHITTNIGHSIHSEVSFYIDLVDPTVGNGRAQVKQK